MGFRPCTYGNGEAPVTVTDGVPKGGDIRYRDKLSN